MVRCILLALLFAAMAIPVRAQTHAEGDVVDRPRDLASVALATFDLSEEGRPALDIRIERTDGGTIAVVISRTGLADDSLDGRRESYVLTQQADTRWTITAAQVEFLCRRGADRTWRSGLCP